MSDAPVLKDAAIKLGRKPGDVEFLTGLSAETMRAWDARTEARHRERMKLANGGNR